MKLVLQVVYAETELQIISLDMILQHKNSEKRNKEREMDREQGVVA